MIKILLLDIDDVLVQPNGYRMAVRAVLNYFADLMQVPAFDLSDTVLHQLEARGITSEWDMLPLLIASLWQEILVRHEKRILPEDVFQAAHDIGKLLNRQPTPLPPVPEFLLTDNRYPSESALMAGLFPAIPAPIRQTLLLDTRDPYRSPITRLFQQYVLGSETYQQVYQLEPDIQSDSFLKKFDIPLLSGQAQKIIKSLSKREGTYLASITARPSSPPREVKVSSFDFAPEAELALELVGLPALTVMGFGKLKYVAEQYGIDPEVLLKPSPVQTLAVLRAVLNGNELAAIQDSVEWQLDRNPKIINNLPDEMDIHVVEDTLGGVRSVREAVAILNQHRKRVRMFPWGLTGDNKEKTEAMAREGVPCFMNWEALLDETNNFSAYGSASE